MKKGKKSAYPIREGFYFDKEAAQRACDFFPRYLRHIKGPKAGAPLELEKWQKDEIIKPIFGWKRADGTRRYRTVYIFIPRKNGKSTLAAGLGLYLLFGDGEQGAEVYSAAGDRDQAAIVFEAAKEMTQGSQPLSKRAECYRRTIVYPRMASSYKVLSSDAPTKHGLNAHGIIFDELHVQPNRELWDTLTTSTGARRQPLTVALTTAGYDKNTICGEVHDYALKVKKGIITDDTFLPVLYGADEGDDWTLESTWQKANPNMGVSVFKDYLQDQCKKATEVVAYENTFKRLHINMWTQQSKKWMAIEKWDESGAAGGPVEEEDLVGRPCFAGLDLANTTDIAALVYLFPFEDLTFKVLCRFFVPEEKVAEQSKKQSDNYGLWTKLGLINATEGDVIDHRLIFKTLEADSKRFQIKELGFDRWGATQIIQDIQDLGITVVPIGQGFASLSGPTKEMIRLVLAKKLHHGNNQVLRWMADNLAVKQDPAGNIKPDKEKSTQKIDGIVALVIALARAIVTDDGSGSVYDSGRGFLTI